MIFFSTEIALFNNVVYCRGCQRYLRHPPARTPRLSVHHNLRGLLQKRKARNLLEGLVSIWRSPWICVSAIYIGRGFQWAPEVPTHQSTEGICWRLNSGMFPRCNASHIHRSTLETPPVRIKGKCLRPPNKNSKTVSINESFHCALPNLAINQSYPISSIQTADLTRIAD